MCFCQNCCSSTQALKGTLSGSCGDRKVCFPKVRPQPCCEGVLNRGLSTRPHTAESSPS